MPIDLGQQCCDANDYLTIGRVCALRFEGCWDPLRPIGAGLYFSLPFRLGMAPRGVILFNVLMLLGAACSGVAVMVALLRTRSRLSLLLFWVLQIAIYGWLVGRSVANSLS